MSEIEIVSPETRMTIKKGIGIYTVLLIVVFLAMKLSNAFSWFPGVLVLGIYLGAGFIMTRVVLRQLVEWHPTYNTLNNVSGTKLRSLIFWPVFYPVLFFKLGINHVL